jgi:hypothetical protein
MAEGSTQGYSSNISKSNTISNNPFSVSVLPRTTSNTVSGEPEPQPNECGFSFLQAFVVSYGTQQATSELSDPTNENERMLPISNMDKVFKMDFSNSGIPARRIYEVEVTVDQEGNPSGAKLQKKPVQGEAGYRANPQNDTIRSDKKMYIPVCETINENVTKVWLRENIHWSLPASEQDHPWKVTDVSTTVSQDGSDGEWAPRISILVHQLDDFRLRVPRIGGSLYSRSYFLDDYDSRYLTVYLAAVSGIDEDTSLPEWRWDSTPRIKESYALGGDEGEGEIGLNLPPIHVLATLTISTRTKQVGIVQITRTRLVRIDGCIGGIPSAVLTGY